MRSTTNSSLDTSLTPYYCNKTVVHLSESRHDAPRRTAVAVPIYEQIVSQVIFSIAAGGLEAGA